MEKNYNTYILRQYALTFKTFKSIISNITVKILTK